MVILGGGGGGYERGTPVLPLTVGCTGEEEYECTRVQLLNEEAAT